MAAFKYEFEVRGLKCTYAAVRDKKNPCYVLLPFCTYYI